MNVAELVAQMPDTDRDLQVRKEAAQQAPPAADPNATPKEKPKADRWGAASKFTGPDPELAARLFEQVLAGGREVLSELARLVRDPAGSEFKDYKAEYFLHGLAVYVSAPGRETQRKLVAQALAAQLGNAKLDAHARGFFIRELRVLGTKETAASLEKLLHDEALCADAAAALVSLGQAEPLRDALRGAKGKCRLTLVQSLGAAGDTASARALRSVLADAEADLRLAAAWALARLGDAPSAEAMLKLADGATGWERHQATDSCLRLAETLAATGRRNEARRIYTHLRATRTGPGESHLRELADKALLALGIG
jgi:HEAT repeat protein